MPGPRGVPGAGAARVVGRMDRVGVIQDRFAPLDMGFEHGQFVQEIGLDYCIGLAGNARGELVGVAHPAEQGR